MQAPLIQFSEFQPFCDEEIEAPGLPVDCLPEWVGNFCRELSASTQTPVDASIMVALAILATACQGKFVVSPFGGDYCEPLNLWTLVSMPPGSRKTAIINALREPLIEWEAEQRKRLQPLINEDEAKRAINKKRLADLQVQAAKDSNPNLLKQIASIQTELDAKPIIAPKLFTGDITPEELQNQLAKYDEKMAVLADEGGIFEVMTGLYNDGKANLDVFLQAWSGSPARINRGSREVVLDKPALSFGLTVQPEIIADLARGNKRKLKGIGALGRFLYASPKSNIGHRDVRKFEEISQSTKQVYFYNVKALLNLAPASPVRLTLDEEAREIYFSFAQYVENRQGDGGEFQDIQDWTAKLPGQALRIAGLFHVSENWTNSTTISAENMTKAAKLCGLLIPHAKATFGLMSIDQATEDAKYLVPHLLGRSEVECRYLSRLGRFSKYPAEKLENAMRVLREHGYISEIQKASGGKRFVYVNPRN